MTNSAVVDCRATTELAWEYACKFCCFECVTTMLLIDVVLVAHNWLLLLLFEHIEALARCLEGLARLRQLKLDLHGRVLATLDVRTILSKLLLLVFGG